MDSMVALFRNAQCVFEEEGRVRLAWPSWYIPTAHPVVNQPFSLILFLPLSHAGSLVHLVGSWLCREGWSVLGLDCLGTITPFLSI